MEKKTTRWQLSEGYVFVDAFKIENQDGENPNRDSMELPFAHIMNCTTYDYTKFNDYAAFILRFIIMGLDTVEIIPKIIASEFPNIRKDPQKDVDDVVAMAGSYLEERKKKRKKHALNHHGGGKKPGGYNLDFGVHSIGPGFIKGPF